MAVRGVELWGWVVETNSGFRVRFDLEEWERLRLYRGQRVAVTGKDVERGRHISDLRGLDQSQPAISESTQAHGQAVLGAIPKTLSAFR